MKPLIVFLHIPKTGGSTIGRYMEMAYGERYTHVAGQQQLAVMDWSQVDAISGHITAADVAAIPRETRVFTVLRNPVDRLASLYRWWYHHDQHSVMEVIRAVQYMTFQEFLDDSAYFIHTRDGMCRQMTQYQNEFDYAAALDYLDTCEIVGTFDQYPQFLKRIARALGWSFPIGDVYSNRVGGHIEITMAHRRHIILNNPHDFALYEYAKLLF